MQVVKTILEITNIVLTLYMIYYAVTGMGAFLKNKKIGTYSPQKKFVILVPARNEAKVIGNLISSLQRQIYPKELYDIYVIPNNCKDNTKEVAQEMGCKILNCCVPVKSKGDVLEFAFGSVPKQYDGYLVFDADNVVDKEFLQKMNDTLCEGYEAAQGYRDSKNPHDSWVSNCYSIYHWIQNYFLNQARMNVGMSAFISGTGFMVSQKLLEKIQFQSVTMTEDTEMTVQYAIRKEKIAFVKDAITYDEQPIHFRDSWKQRKRWSAGTVSCLKEYHRPLIKSKNRNAVDVFMVLLLPIVQVLGILTCFIYTSIELMFTLQIDVMYKIIPFLMGYAFSSFMAIFVLILCKKSIRKNWKGILGFPLFVFSWIFINIVVLLKHEEVWEEMHHTRTVTIEAASKAEGILQEI